MKLLLLSLCLWMSPLGLIAENNCSNQPTCQGAFHNQRGNALNEQIQARRVAFISSQAQFTPAEAEKFWPIYTEFQKNKRKLHQDILGLLPRQDQDHSALDKLTEQEAKIVANQRISLAKLELQFHQDIQELLPPKKVIRFYQAEMEFQKELLKAYKKDKSKGTGKKPE